MTVYGLHYLTLHKKPKHGINELKQRLNDSWDCISQGIIDEPSGKRGSVHV